ncbi:ceramide kinase-like isoform X2 [Mangifera indica]|uniref:ceramide kinase-like isoform X2 n=1 Tax=Mangifera indica TaxID=29780 RepID=UPI001CF9F297|nr:ceramide kinase-like isoform X2 [Mangifera indica]
MQEIYCWDVRLLILSFRKSKTQPNVWVLAVYTFGHKDLPTCEMWVNRLSASLSLEVGRPKNLLVFVNPMSGKTNAGRTWETVAPIFARAKIEAKVVVTERAGHAFDVMTSTTNKEFNSYDGVIAVGGDGFFNEILNGYLSSRYKAPYPPAPTDFAHSVGSDDCSLVHNPDKRVVEASDPNDDQYPRLPSSQHYGSGSSNFLQDAEFPHHNEWFRFGIIPAGSTDAIAMCTTGARDPVTSALHIILGKRVCLDIAQIVSWRETATSKVEPRVRYAASFAGYGFYGDVITESEKYRWMGPKRYDYAGTKVFMRHRSYEAEVAYLDVESGKTHAVPDRGRRFGRLQTSRSRSKSERVICRTNCNICNKKSSHSMPYSCPKETRWLRSKGRFLSVGAAIISNRNERAPDGLVVDAHLSDGLLHLILIKDCPHALYLWHLTELARKGGNPLNFEFVEHHKTPAFTFTSSGNDSVWNIDGELFRAHQLSAQVFQGLISLFASGPEV